VENAPSCRWAASVCHACLTRTPNSGTPSLLVSCIPPTLRCVCQCGRYQSRGACARLLKVGLDLIAALPNRDNRRRRNHEARPMKRQSRDGFLAVVHPDCDVLQKGAVMQCKASSRSAGPARGLVEVEGGRRARNLATLGVSNLISTNEAMFCLSSNPP
jgi:hypothetical protein